MMMTDPPGNSRGFHVVVETPQSCVCGSHQIPRPAVPDRVINDDQIGAVTGDAG
jgi:hypothetical protein